MLHHLRRPLMRVGMILGGIVLAAGLAFLFGLLVMALWNWIMPELFGLKPLTYRQSWGIVLLAHILFKAGGHQDLRHRRSDEEAWKDRFRERFKKRFWEGRPHEEQPPKQPETPSPS